MKMKEVNIRQLLMEVEQLCAVYIGKNAESEPWGDTCDRIASLDRLIKKIRRAEKKGEPTGSCRARVG